MLGVYCVFQLSHVSVHFSVWLNFVGFTQSEVLVQKKNKHHVDEVYAANHSYLYDADALGESS